MGWSFVENGNQPSFRDDGITLVHFAAYPHLPPDDDPITSSNLWPLKASLRLVKDMIL